MWNIDSACVGSLIWALRRERGVMLLFGLWMTMKCWYNRMYSDEIWGRVVGNQTKGVSSESFYFSIEWLTSSLKHFNFLNAVEERMLRVHKPTRQPLWSLIELETLDYLLHSNMTPDLCFGPWSRRETSVKHNSCNSTLYIWLVFVEGHLTESYINVVIVNDQFLEIHVPVFSWSQNKSKLPHLVDSWGISSITCWHVRPLLPHRVDQQQ